MAVNHRTNSLIEKVARLAGVAPEAVCVVRSPYRACPLGAHVDHQLGEVTGMALDRAILFAFVPRPEPSVHVESNIFPGSIELNLPAVPPSPPGDWGDYLRGAVHALKSKYDLKHGLIGIVDGYEKVGGLSSSAAVGVAYLMALEKVNDLPVTDRENIELDRMIENEYIGLNNGLLDQSTILLSRKGRLMYLDCASGETELYSCEQADDLRIVVLYSGLENQLCDTDYNRRVAECEEAARLLLEKSATSGEEPKLRSVPRPVFERHEKDLPDPLARRARHFFSEQRRVRRGIEVWQNGDLDTFGRLVTESGQSSVENYECGNRYLRGGWKALVETPRILGARFSGAGFRGCSIGLLNGEPPEEMAGEILDRYLQQHPDMGGKAEVYYCRPDDGARFVT